MSLHRAEISWRLEGDFASGRFSRAHRWRFDGGLDMPASASPAVMPSPMSDPQAVDPEEAFVAAIASCHMMSFLHVARLEGVAVTTYHDAAVGRMARLGPGRHWVERVDLNIRAEFEGAAPDPARQEAMHAAAHALCFIANSVKSEIVVNLI
ncbi:OsmC family peroxiredoxin [Halovulum dunhuangense]|uniref:OsmC family peroxiredoxin n=1 Tax=Halovulum dunhuangense TaxID=1505036 RepID=A0A849L4H3_9RHOB|nr:OsmC family protein [Halovulum dunhuangense]NNU81256.1 OsmC family peroxiredoxin [Halovulum dunhuangense]